MRKKKVDKVVERINTMSNEEFLETYKGYVVKSGVGGIVGLVMACLLFALLAWAFKL